MKTIFSFLLFLPVFFFPLNANAEEPATKEKKEKCLHDEAKAYDGRLMTAEVCLVQVNKLYFNTEWMWGTGNDPKPPFTMISSLTVVIGGFKQHISPSAYIDLANITGVMFPSEPSGSRLTELLLFSEKGEHNYFVNLVFKGGDIESRGVRFINMGDWYWEDTTYHNTLEPKIDENGDIIGGYYSDGTVIMYDKPKKRNSED